ncbi:hypothetical protein BKA70DRAFT_1435294 [Coprinopsis sp. MPI-PUGE-AT-0042]|nr:hypothetical protein BKA70DRAFT_1435294 [Coprinopsis sp. MPI-PUGE-AT-0042]
MSVVVSIVTTVMISARLVLMEKQMKRLALRSGTFRSVLPYRQVIALLLESAVPFTLVGVAGAIITGLINARNSEYSRAVSVFPFIMVLWTNALALGPQVIIFRIISGTKWSSNPTTRRSRPISQPLMFDDDPVVSIIASAYADNEHELEEGGAHADNPSRSNGAEAGDGVGSGSVIAL